MPRPDNEVLAIATGRGHPHRARTYPEQDQQIALLEALVGKSGKGPRIPGEGLTGRWPELGLIYAVPNGYAKTKGAAGRAKAEGLLRAVPDLVLPVARFPFHGLYLEGKIKGEKLREDQDAYITELVAQGYAALPFFSVQQGLDIVVRYLSLSPYHAVAQPPGPYRIDALSRLQRPIMRGEG